ncbi:hypothetical protein ASF55_16100 [Methylobacterium sp. Leaf119]|nr:flagellin domain protein [Methylorubrum extorquens PA1]KQP85855.1 hypothetical protein ASF55_16100 [Methylobacterium sp. Leaf119]
MTCVFTNPAAVVALQTLRAVVRDRDATLRRLSTGLRIGSAADEAAYWAIASTLRADNGSLATTRDAISHDRNTVEAMARRLDRVIDQLGAIGRTLVSASGAQADTTKLQVDLRIALDAIRLTADNAIMNGANWLSVNSEEPNFSVTRNLVTAFSCQGGSVAVGTSAFDTSGIILFDARAREDGRGAFSRTPAVGCIPTLARGIARTASVASPDGYRLQTWDGPSQRGGQTLYLTWNHGLLDTQFYVRDGNAEQQPFSIASMDLTSPYADAKMIQAYAKVVDATLQVLLDGAAKLGATSALLSLQQNFAGRLMDINASAIGALVDADIEEASARLKALRVQQQLGLQSLNIANGASQAILVLFRQ